MPRSRENCGCCYYFIGLSGSGKTTIAGEMSTKIRELYPFREVTVLDGDVVRQNLSSGLGFSKEDRSINVRRIGYVASEIVKHGGIVICANIAPYDEDRLFNRGLIERYGRYREIWMNIPLEICEKRDAKGLYKLAREGTIKQFTGISDPFEPPTKADLVITLDYNVTDVIGNL
jgi:sulfate adenylyltransferase